MSAGTEFAKIPTTATARNTETEGEEQNGLLKKFKDIVLKQRPESVSHLLQDNLPKCKIVCQTLPRAGSPVIMPSMLKFLSHFSCIHLPV